MLRRIGPGGGIAAGFTLMELLVVVAIMTILMSILLPSLGSARESGRAVYCSNNVRQVLMANGQYGDDNHDTWPGRATVQEQDYANTLGAWLPCGDSGDPNFDLRKGSLYPFLKTAGVYYCPSDPAHLENRSSYSVNANLYGTSVSLPYPAPGHPLIRYPRPGRFTQPPDRLVVLVDSGRLIDGSFLPIRPSRPIWTGPSSLPWNHREKAAFGFADSHVTLILKGDPITQDYLNPAWFPDESNLEVVQ